jgi:hypothetical protein
MNLPYRVVHRLQAGRFALAIGALCLLATGAGCSRLDVRKINPACRNTKADYDVKGFRYYLARPYVVVKEPIKLAENVELDFLPADSEPIRTWLNMDSGEKECSSLSTAEWRKMKQVIAAKQEDSGGDNSTRSGEDIVLAQATAPAGATDIQYMGIEDDEVPEPTSLTGKIQIVFLPDLDEQYAVHHCNVMAAGAYKLLFKDGWQLVSVDGEFDATEVATELVKTVEAALKAASSGGGGGEGAGDRGSLVKVPVKAAGLIPVKVTRTQTIMPGVYRINKPWEVTVPNCASHDLLGKLGMEVIETVKVEPLTETGT